MSTRYRGCCACCGIPHRNKKFKSLYGYPIPPNVVPTDLKYFSVENYRLCGGCKASIYKSTNTSKDIPQIDTHHIPMLFPNDSIPNTSKSDNENISVEFSQNINIEEKKIQ